MFEHHSKPLISGGAFVFRFFKQLFLTLVLILFSLAFGVVGYHHFENMSWLDALLNASMILGGMGPISTLVTIGGKLFASFYSLYSGIFLIVCGGLLLAPVFHRILHHFHSQRDL